jgi:PhoPQ-activated pathogenicity-related protein
MIHEPLKLMQSKWNNDLIIPMYIINIPNGSFNIDNEIYYYFKKNIT